jgi:hypothetical protein
MVAVNDDEPWASGARVDACGFDRELHRCFNQR